MTDKELLMFAAKAAGYGEVWYVEGNDKPYVGPRYRVGEPVKYRIFNPLTDDGDALRLAVRCRFHVCVFSATTVDGVESLGFVEVWNEDSELLLAEYVEHGNYEAATRRAIVSAAAEIGKAMP